MKDAGNRFTEHILYGFNRYGVVLNTRMQHNSHDGISTQSNLIDNQHGCLQSCENGVQPKDVAFYLTMLYGIEQVFTNLDIVTKLKGGGYLPLQFGIERKSLLAFFFRKLEFYHWLLVLAFGC